jgi:miniconductance mechanosensitive channel
MQDMISASFLSWITDTNLKLIFSEVIILILIALVAKGVDYLIRNLFLTLLNNWLSNSRFRFVKLIVRYRVFNALFYIVSGLVFVLGSFILVKNNQPLTVVIATTTLKFANLFNLFILTLTFNRIIHALHDYYESSRRDITQHPIHSYVKVITFCAWLMTTILAASYILNRAPLDVITGIGAISAFFLLIFRDTFLGIVASIQANALSIVRIGDWVTIDKYKVDGVVTDISITNVKLQNWDNTVTTIPTYALTAEAVQNWSYMSMSGGRRIKESILIATDSICFVDMHMIKRLSVKYPLLSQYIDGQNITNLGLFRKFLLNYLILDGRFNSKYVIDVRNQTPTPYGLPIEIYAFTNDVTSIGHSDIKSEIFEYICATLPDFNLQISVQKA